MKIINLIFLFFFPIIINAQSNLQFTNACENISIEVNTVCDNVSIDLNMPVTTDCSIGSFLIKTYTIDYFSNGFIDEVLTGTIGTLDFEVGEHIVIYTVEDQCGTSITCERIVTFYDNIPPTIFCPNLFSVNFINDLEISFSVNSVNYFDNCTSFDDVFLSYSLDSLQEILTIDCNDLHTVGIGNSIFQPIYAVDEFGNIDSCLFQIILNDPFSICNSLLFDSIFICAKYVNGEPVQDYTVNDMPILDVNPCGIFIPNGVFNTIHPDKNSNPRNGVNLLDLLLLQRSIVVSPFDEVYETVAGDLNHSGQINESDFGMLRFFLTRVIDELTSSRSWRFVRDDFIFNNPNSLPPSYNFLPASLLLNDTINFTAIKSGDINFSADPSEMTNGVEEPILGELKFCAEDEILTAGEQVTIDLYAKDFNDILGFQFTIEFDSSTLKYFTFEGSNLPNVEYGTFADNKINEGLLPMVWIDKSSQGISINDDLRLFRLKFLVLKDAVLSDVFTINETRIPMDAYGEIGRLAVDFQFCNSVAHEDLDLPKFRLLKNFPNPFTESMEIPFEIVDNQEVTLTVLSVDGRRITKRTQHFPSGLNSFFIKKSDLPSDGLYFFEVKTVENTEVGKMILN